MALQAVLNTYVPAALEEANVARERACMEKEDMHSRVQRLHSRLTILVQDHVQAAVELVTFDMEAVIEEKNEEINALRRQLTLRGRRGRRENS